MGKGFVCVQVFQNIQHCQTVLKEYKYFKTENTFYWRQGRVSSQRENFTQIKNIKTRTIRSNWNGKDVPQIRYHQYLHHHLQCHQIGFHHHHQAQMCPFH